MCVAPLRGKISEVESMNPKNLKHEIQESKVTARVGYNGITESLILEIKDQLRNRKLVKVKANKGVLDASSRRSFWNELATKTESQLISQKGNVAVFLKEN